MPWHSAFLMKRVTNRGHEASSTRRILNMCYYFYRLHWPRVFVHRVWKISRTKEQTTYSPTHKQSSSPSSSFQPPEAWISKTQQSRGEKKERKTHLNYLTSLMNATRVNAVLVRRASMFIKIQCIRCSRCELKNTPLFSFFFSSFFWFACAQRISHYLAGRLFVCLRILSCVW